MDSLFLFALIAFVMAASAWLLVRHRAAASGSAAVWPYHARPVLTAAQQVAYHRLVTALPSHVVLAHLPLARVLAVTAGHDVTAWTRRLEGLSCDFVVCSPDATVLAIVSLDTPAPASLPRARLGALGRLVRATDAAGLRRLQWRSEALPDVPQIRALFAVPIPTGFEADATPQRRRTDRPHDG